MVLWAIVNSGNLAGGLVAVGWSMPRLLYFNSSSVVHIHGGRLLGEGSLRGSLI